MEFVVVIGWIASAFFCATVAEEKGYSSVNWCILGFLFGFFTLIAVAGLPDRKLRKYIRQIGEKPKTSKPDDEEKGWEGDSSDWNSKKRTIQFVMPAAANKLQIFNKLKSEVNKNEEYQKIFDDFKINSYEINESLLGGKEFVLLAKDLRTLFILSGKKLNNIQTQWEGEF